MKNPNRFLAVSAAALGLTLAGCSGDDRDDSVAATPPAVVVPANPSVSAAAFANAGSFVSYIMGLSANDETSEPLTIDSTLAVPPEDSAEPKPLV